MRKSKRGGLICKYPEKKFIIKSFSASKISVYYDDLRTNNSCKCSNCQTYSDKSQNLKCIGIYNIKIIKTRLQRLRDIKLKQLI